MTRISHAPALSTSLTRPAFLACLLVAGIGAPATTQAKISTGSEEVYRLDLQGQMDTKAPFSKTLWAGAHNAYAAFDWDDGTYTDVNQYYAPEDLFARGIRAIEYDVYPQSGTDSDPEMCHYNQGEDTSCAGAEGAMFGDGLWEIRHFLEDGNMDEVLFVKLEVYDNVAHDNFRNKVADKIEDILGDYVYRPSDWGHPEETCASLPVQQLTKQDVLMAGRNVVLMTQVPRDLPADGDADLCEYHDESGARRMLDWVWIGVDEIQLDGTLVENEPMGQNGSQLIGPPGEDSATTHYDAGNFSVKLDTTTEYEAENQEHTDIYGAEILELAREGYNILELALVEAHGHGLDIPISDSPEIRDYVWSWLSNHPNGSASCALTLATGLLYDEDCDEERAFACVDADRDWTITSGTGAWAGGFSACPEGTSFGMPYNALEHKRLGAAKAAAGRGQVWVNYQEAIPGFWVASADEALDVRYAEISAWGISNSGDAFDHYDLVKRRLLTDGALTPSVVRLGQDSNGIFNGIEICYKHDGAGPLCTSVGDTSFTSFKMMNLGATATLESATICKFDRVNYVQLTRSNGTSISRGIPYGSCTTVGADGLQLFAMHGTGTDSLVRSLGFHQIAAD